MNEREYYEGQKMDRNELMKQIDSKFETFAFDGYSLEQLRSEIRLLVSEFIEETHHLVKEMSDILKGK